MKTPKFEEIYTAQISQVSPSSISVKSGGEWLNVGWVPLWQTIVWVGFWVFLILFVKRNFNQQIGGLFTAFVTRIQEGSPVKIGNFVELDGPPAIKNQQVRTATTEGVEGIAIPKDINEIVLNYQENSAGIAEEVYLIHTAEVIVPRTFEKQGKYRVRIWLEAYPEVDFNEYLCVTYRLHKTFKRQVIATKSQKNQFELWLNVFGEFTVIAYVERKDKEPLWLTRYLDLPGRPPE